MISGIMSSMLHCIASFPNCSMDIASLRHCAIAYWSRCKNYYHCYYSSYSSYYCYSSYYYYYCCYYYCYYSCYYYDAYYYSSSCCCCCCSDNKYNNHHKDKDNDNWKWWVYDSYMLGKCLVLSPKSDSLGQLPKLLRINQLMARRILTPRLRRKWFLAAARGHCFYQSRHPGIWRSSILLYWFEWRGQPPLKVTR